MTEGNNVSTNVPDLIAALYEASSTEVVQLSQGPVSVKRDPHLRLRRTLTPSSPNVGLKKYKEAQFMIDDSTGKRINLTFFVLGQEFQMDAYVWGASEDEAEQRMVTLHGISPGVSRTRWHTLGDRIGKSTNKNKLRFVALDWHSIDRTDQPQEEFLTMLPKHMFSAPAKDSQEEILAMYSDDRQEWARDFFAQIRESCPRSTKQGAEALRAVIEQGLGWGTAEKPFILGVKSWSGGLGVSMLLDAARRKDDFRKGIAGAVIMHPACYLDEADCATAVKDLPVLMCWAKDDPMVPYLLSSRFLVHEKVKLVTMEEGGHANFDGTDDLPNFDDIVLTWLDEQTQVE